MQIYVSTSFDPMWFYAMHNANKEHSQYKIYKNKILSVILKLLEEYVVYLLTFFEQQLFACINYSLKILENNYNLFKYC